MSRGNGPGGFFAVDSLTSVHALVVDDDASCSDVLVSLLRYCGALVTAVGTPDDALSAMDHVKPDVLVMTITTAGRTISLAGRVRARKPEDGGNAPIVAIVRQGAADVPVIAVTGYDEVHRAERTLSAGFDGHVRKPIDPWELARLVGALARPRT